MSDSWSEHEEFELVWDDVDLLEYEGGGCGLYSGNDSASDIVLVLERDEFVDDTDDAEEAISVGGKAKNTTSKKKKILKIGKRSDRTAFNSRNRVNIYNLFFFLACILFCGFVYISAVQMKFSLSTMNTCT